MSLIKSPPTVYRWRTHQGEHVLPSEMETGHLVYSLRMVFNHTVPEEFRVPGGKRWADIDHWPADYLRASVKHLMEEAIKRKDLTAGHAAILHGMRRGYIALIGHRFANN